MDDKQKKEYQLPKVLDFIKDNKIANTIDKAKYQNFITMLDKEEVINMPIDYNPNILIYGLTEYGKSSFITSIITNVLLKQSPESCRMLIIDTKKLDYMFCKKVPHLLRPIVSDINDAKDLLRLVEREVNGRIIDNKDQPYLYFIIDGLDELLVRDLDIAETLLRILQYSRTTKTFVIAATKILDKKTFDQRILTMFSTRVCFRTLSKNESISMLNFEGAEDLNRGEFYINTPQNKYDGLYTVNQIDDESFKSLSDYVCTQQETIYDSKFINFDFENRLSAVGDETVIDVNSDDDFEIDEKQYNEVVEFVVQMGKASASLLQRRFKFGYFRAAKIIDLLEEREIIGPATGNSKPREVLVKYGNDSDDEIEEQQPIENNNYQNNTNNYNSNNYNSYNGVQRQMNKQHSEAIFKMIMGIVMIGIVINALVIAVSH